MNILHAKNKNIKIFISVFVIFAFLALFYININTHAESTGTATDAAEEEKESRGTAKPLVPSLIEKGYMSVLYNSENGLPTSEANAIVQTPDGFIWIGGYSGLVRYDGNDFYRFDSTKGITSVASLFVDSKGRLWIGTNDNGVALFEEGEFTFFGQNNELKSNAIKAISEDSSGNIIIGTTSGMEYIDSSNTLHILEDERLDGMYINGMSKDSEGVIYVISLDGDIFTIDNLKVDNFYRISQLPYKDIISICVDADNPGHIYLGTETQTIIKTDIYNNIKSYEEISTGEKYHINKIYPDREGFLWVSADNGIGYIDSNNKFVEIKNSLLDSSIDNIASDYEGNMWFASSRQGLMKMVYNNFADISSEAGIENTVTNSTCMYKGLLYIGTDKGLFIVDDKKQIETEITNLLNGIRIRCLKTDTKGNIWICTYGGEYGLICYNGDTGEYRMYNEDNGLNSNRVRSVTVMSNGDIVASGSGGINVISKGEIVKSYDKEDGVTNTEILSTCEGSDGAILAGSDGNGVYIIKDDKVTNISQEDGLKSGVILRIKKDPKADIYWLITGNSLAYLDGETVNTISEFPYSNNFDIFFGEDDTAWVLSSNGIYVVNRDALVNKSKIKYTFYNIDDGMPYYTTANSRSYMDEDGNIYICGSKGVFKVNIYDVENLSKEIKIDVPFISVDDELKYISNNKITIPKNCKRFSIYAYVLSFALQDSEVEYFLEGYEDEPISTSSSELEPISYTNLSGGDYKFQFRIIDGRDEEILQTITVDVHVEKKFIETPWFVLCIILAVIFLAGMIALLWTYRKTRKFKEREIERQIFINQIIRAFGKAIDLKDKYTNGHSQRVSEYAADIAKELGYKDSDIEYIRNAGLLHDIGKITIPDRILNKPGKLTDEEYAIMKKHSQYGYDILKEISSYKDIYLGARYHHERIDGKGYPSGKSGDEIPKIARIIAVADTFDAMNSTRSYRQKMKMEDIIKELKRVSGTQLDSEIVEALLKLIEDGKVS